ncbi:MAG: nitrous oxide-stimulated promoter family protein [Coriobacteriia bacterium]|jgi:hypothetical protein|nr:nitrous oxide-stimulated promoter family protein [Coriobacteriia bacterium]
MEDTPKIHKKRLREKQTISQMVALYCADAHAASERFERAFCGEALCSECLVLDEYAIKRTERCRSMDIKTTCEECGNHCYDPAKRESIRAVMRYSGPRMLKKHPIAALRHLAKR